MLQSSAPVVPEKSAFDQNADDEHEATPQVARNQVFARWHVVQCLDLQVGFTILLRIERGIDSRRSVEPFE